jgi:hypothetical protein
MKVIKGIIKRIKREKIEAILQKIRYRIYQANIALQSHDGEKLLDMARRIRINGLLIYKALGKGRGKRKLRKAEGNGKRKRRSSKRSKSRD